MPDYKKGQIYKIVNNENSNVYYGSTIQPLYKRMYKHRHKHNNCMSKKIGIDIKECKIILVEKYPCNSKYELESRERYYIENFECVNKNIPTRTMKEYNESIKDKLKEYREKYNVENKEKIKLNKQKYYIKNKDKINERNNKYRTKNKQKYKQNARVKITCDCGAIICKDRLWKHKKTKKHLRFINKN